MKASEAHNLKDDELLERIRQTARGAVRAAPPARHRRAREHGADHRGPPRRRAAADRRQGARDRPGTRAEELMADEEKNEQTRDEEQAPERDAPSRGAPGRGAPRRRRPPRRSRRGGARRGDEPLPRRRLPRRLPLRRPPRAEARRAEGAGRPTTRWRASTGRRAAASSAPAQSGRGRPRAEPRGTRRRARGEAPRRPTAGARLATGRSAAPRARPARHCRRPSATPSPQDPAGPRRLQQARQDDHRPRSTSPAAIRPTRRSCAARSTLHAHDDANEAGEGDLVRVVETRPLSRTKRWRLVEILEKAK